MQTEGSKPALGTLGQKYDQYIDFAQLPQDAHEFFRIAMGMEEQDIFKIPRNNDTDSRRLSVATLPCTPGFRCVPYRTWVMEKAEDADEEGRHVGLLPLSPTTPILPIPLPHTRLKRPTNTDAQTQESPQDNSHQHYRSTHQSRLDDRLPVYTNPYTQMDFPFVSRDSNAFVSSPPLASALEPGKTFKGREKTHDDCIAPAYFGCWICS